MEIGGDRYASGFLEERLSLAWSHANFLHHHLSPSPSSLGLMLREKVYFGEHSGEKALHEIEDIHHSYLLSVKETQEDVTASLLYSYKHSINGFAAVLTEDEASKLSELEEVVSVWPSHPRKYTMHTTRSWEFVGIEEEEEGSYWKHNQMGGD